MNRFVDEGEFIDATQIPSVLLSSTKRNSANDFNSIGFDPNGMNKRALKGRRAFVDNSNETTPESFDSGVEF